MLIVSVKHTFILPASISKEFIQNYLRKKYNYNGLIITDDIKMGSVSLFYRFVAFVKAFSSGSDIILFKYNNGDEKIIEKIKDKIQKEKISISEINKSVERIIKIKKKYQINDNTSFLGCNVEEINKEIDRINKEYEKRSKNEK